MKTVCRLTLAVAMIPTLVACGGGNGGGSGNSQQTRDRQYGQQGPYQGPNGPQNQQQQQQQQRRPGPMGYQDQSNPQNRVQNPNGPNNNGAQNNGAQSWNGPQNSGIPQGNVVPSNTSSSTVTPAAATAAQKTGASSYQVRSSNTGAKTTTVATQEADPTPAVSALSPKSAPLATASVQTAQSVQSVVAPVVAATEVSSAPATVSVAITEGAPAIEPGLPRGYIASRYPLYTGATDSQGLPYTDGKDDSIMATMVEKMNQLEPTVLAESEQLASAVSDVQLNWNGQVANVEVTFQFSDDVVKASFTGLFQSRSASLSTRSLVSERGQALNYQLRATLVCADVKTECRNNVIVIEQIVDQKVCRKVYLVHRNMVTGVGDGHFTLSHQDYSNWKTGTNSSQRAFLRILSNTVHFNRVMFNEVPKEEFRSPRLAYLGVRIWAVAYGRSNVEINMNKLENGNRRGDSTRFYGPLVIPGQGQSADTLNIAGDYRNPEINDMYDERFDRGISQAVIVENDGRGKLSLDISFYNNPRVSRVSFTGLDIDTLSRNSLAPLIP